MNEKLFAVKPIRSEEDYAAALNRAAELMNAPADTIERLELEVLYDLIEHYEDRHHPINPPGQKKV
jgi:HTH-type transcriptional regulator/antitoxin HigA